ncbi:MAG TPA: Rieske 2Fe-2S domain-containing protein [Gemmatimonadaceae bacterium]|nr:Rieske 2Fe-2S domain-containing protein [Gemmatimonadaceae bacterium]
MLTEACGDGQIGPPLGHVDVGTVAPFNVSKFPGLATVGTVVDIGNQRAIVRTGPTTFLGLSRICTHEGCVTDVTNNRFECPCHGSIFAADGAVVRGPNIASAPITPLQQLTVTFDPATGIITVT